MTIVTTSADSVRPTRVPQTSWQHAMKTAIRDPMELCRVLELPDDFTNAAIEAAESFPVFAPRQFVRKMKLGDSFDPLLRQVLPLGDELQTAAGFGVDPLGEDAATLSPGLVQKYQGRALLVVTGACAIHCRYCFRRHFPYEEIPHSIEGWTEALERIEADKSIDEILLSGGDPLTLVDSQLAELADRISGISHVRRLRVHTRLPIVIPQRVTDTLIQWLTGTRLVPIFVVHANHPAELDESVAGALAKLVDAGIPVLNQAVLLRGVNDSADTLVELCRRLVDLRVMPYYLHQLDRVSGAAHFDVPLERGRALIREVQARLPGYAVPKFVREVADEASKTVLL